MLQIPGPLIPEIPALTETASAFHAPWSVIGKGMRVRSPSKRRPLPRRLLARVILKRVKFSEWGGLSSRPGVDYTPLGIRA
jgi:hypothetical protein